MFLFFNITGKAIGDTPSEIKNNYNDYKDTQYLSYNILLLPIHQDLNEGHLSKIYKSLDSALACTKNLY